MDPIVNITRQRAIVAGLFASGSDITHDNALEVLVELAELVDALDKWRLKDGYDPYRYERAESMTSEQLDQELIRTLSEQLRHLRSRFPDEGDAVIALDAVLDRWDDFYELTREAGEQ